jgi:hypothetical protein
MGKFVRVVNSIFENEEGWQEFLVDKEVHSEGSHELSHIEFEELVVELVVGGLVLYEFPNHAGCEGELR